MYVCMYSNYVHNLLEKSYEVKYRAYYEAKYDMHYKHNTISITYCKINAHTCMQPHKNNLKKLWFTN